MITLTAIPRKMNNDESKLYATIVCAEREILLNEAIRSAAMKRLEKMDEERTERP